MSKMQGFSAGVMLVNSLGNNRVNAIKTKDNTKRREDLVRHRHKFAPFTEVERRKRRTEVYKLHFENGMPATRIAQLMNVDRNTINKDLKFLYRQALIDYNLDQMSVDDILEKQLVRLEAQRDRLGLYLSDAKEINNKIAIERLIADIDFRVLTAVEKIYHNESRFWDEIIKGVNKVAEINNLHLRYSSLFELHKISIDSRKSLDEIREDALIEKKGNR